MAQPRPSPTIRLELRVLGERVVAEGPRPPDRTRLDQVLPLLRSLDNAVIDLAVRKVEATGEKVACCKGCAACCKAQPVPVTPPEAYALWRLVGALPEPRRTEVRQRFANNVERLRAEGLLPVFLDDNPTITKAEARGIAERYFELGLHCPFLVDDACGIYEDRPFVCRQYLVTSPAELCVDPFHNPVKPVPMVISPAKATLGIAEGAIGRAQRTVPLALALEYAERYRGELERTYPGVELTQRWVQAILTSASQ